MYAVNAQTKSLHISKVSAGEKVTTDTLARSKMDLRRSNSCSAQ